MEKVVYKKSFYFNLIHNSINQKQLFIQSSKVQFYFLIDY
jgi:hypothetical protein